MLRLGNSIIFDGLLSPDSVRRSRGAKYAEIAVATGKPRLQRVGTDLEEISLPVRLNRQFCDPPEVLALFDAARIAGTVMELTSTAGTVFGNFIVVSVSENIVDADKDGNVIEVSLDVTLKEYFDPDPSATLSAQARTKAFANDTAKVLPVTPFATPITPPASISGNARGAVAANNSANDLMVRAQTDTTEQLSLMARAKAQVEKAAEKVDTVKKQLQQYLTLAAAAPNMLAAATSAYSLLQGTITALAAGNLGAALANISTVDDALLTMVKEGLPIETLVISRRG